MSSFLYNSSFTSFASENGYEIFVVENSSNTAVTNLCESQKFKHPIFTDLKFSDDFAVVSSPSISVTSSVAIMKTFFQNLVDIYIEESYGG